MAYATLEDVRGMTTISTVASLSDDVLQNYIDRASAWIRRDTRQSFDGETDADILLDLRIATTLLVEYLWYWDQSDVKDGQMSNAESERIGSYSYTTKAVPGESTGNKELDSILASLRVSDNRGLFLFSVSGPSRMKKNEF